MRSGAGVIRPFYLRYYEPIAPGQQPGRFRLSIHAASRAPPPPPPANHTQSDDAEEERGGLGDDLTARTMELKQQVDVETIHNAVPVQVSLGLISSVNQDINKFVDSSLRLSFLSLPRSQTLTRIDFRRPFMVVLRRRR